jgi:hypothetical protein
MKAISLKFLVIFSFSAICYASKAQQSISFLSGTRKISPSSAINSFKFTASNMLINGTAKQQYAVCTINPPLPAKATIQFNFEFSINGDIKTDADIIPFMFSGMPPNYQKAKEMTVAFGQGIGIYLRRVDGAGKNFRVMYVNQAIENEISKNQFYKVNTIYQGEIKTTGDSIVYSIRESNKVVATTTLVAKVNFNQVYLYNGFEDNNEAINFTTSKLIYATSEFKKIAAPAGNTTVNAQIDNQPLKTLLPQSSIIFDNGMYKTDFGIQEIVNVKESTKNVLLAYANTVDNEGRKGLALPKVSFIDSNGRVTNFIHKNSSTELPNLPNGLYSLVTEYKDVPGYLPKQIMQKVYYGQMPIVNVPGNGIPSQTKSKNGKVSLTIKFYEDNNCNDIKDDDEKQSGNLWLTIRDAEELTRIVTTRNYDGAYNSGKFVANKRYKCIIDYENSRKEIVQTESFFTTTDFEEQTIYIAKKICNKMPVEPIKRESPLDLLFFADKNGNGVQDNNEFAFQFYSLHLTSETGVKYVFEHMPFANKIYTGKMMLPWGKYTIDSLVGFEPPLNEKYSIKNIIVEVSNAWKFTTLALTKE